MNELDQILPRPLGRSHPVTPRRRLVGEHPQSRRSRTFATRGSGLPLARLFKARLRVTDNLIVAGAGIVAMAIQVLFFANDPATLARLLVIGLLVVGVWIATLGIFQTRDSRVLCVGLTEYKRVVSASTMTFGLLGIGFVIGEIEIARPFFVVAFPLGIVGLVLDRWIWRKWLAHQSRSGRSLSQVIVVGSRQDVDYVVRQIARKSGAAYSVVGVVIDGDADEVRQGVSKAVPISTDLDGVAATASRLGADAVIVAGTPRGRENFVHDLAWELEGMSTDLIIATNLANVAGPRIHLRPMEGLPLIHVEIPEFEGGKHVLKRAFDVAVSSLALLVLSPLLALVAVVIALDSPGSALFRQERVGRDGKKFTMYKFRSMVTTAPDDLSELINQNEGAGVLFKLKHDPRVTRVGRFIRKHSIDEFPQLWNILIGDMSIVGPRPPLPREVQGYEDHVHRRLYIRPGLTGMWQVNGRSTLDWEESVQLDLFYVENWSLVGDIVIVWRTFRQLVNPVGAY
jgi:exopolysaccharide biosynthesis polyprenyl glycosylphosphotransferase